jgi:PAS domain S-box-containing protein
MRSEFLAKDKRMFKNMKIGTKILIAFTLVAIVAVSLVGFFAFTTGSSALEEESFNKLTAVREMKASQIEDYFQLIENQVITLSQDRMIIEAMRDLDDGIHAIEGDLGITETEMQEIDARLREYYEEEFLPRLTPNLLEDVSVEDFWPEDGKTRVLQDLYLSSNPFEVGSKHLLDNSGDGSSYSQAHETYHPIIRDYLEKFGYYDIFLVDVDSGGHIAYSVFKEVDFGTSLLTGPYADTNFAEAYNAARVADNKDFVIWVDFEPYPPSYNAPAAFIASPIFDGEEKIGVLVFQFPIDRINAIMTSNQDWSSVGLGESGETYIVGNDFLLRNQSRFLIEDSENYFLLIEEIGTPQETIAQIRNFNSKIGLQEVKTDGTKAALSGLSGAAIFPDYRGVPVLSSYKPLDIRGVNWAIMSEIDQEEAFAPIRSLGTRTLVGVLVLIAAIVILAIAFSRTITRPLNELTQTADELANGNLDVEVAFTDQRDEIGTLASSFDTMRVSMKGLIGNLEDINQNLENLVDERTKELELATERVRTIVEIAPDAVITIDEGQTITLFNPKAEDIFGYSADEVLGQPLTMLMPEKSRGIHGSEVGKFGQESLSSRGMDNRREIIGQRKDGSTFPAEAGISKMKINGQQYFTTFFRDITDRKEMEARILEQNKELELSERKSTSIIESAGEGIVVIDQNSTVILWNETAERMFGYTKEEMVGDSLTHIVPEQYLTHHDTAMKQATQTGELAHPGVTHEVSGRRKDDTEFPMELTVSQWTISGETYYSGILRDITERKEAEEIIRENEARFRSLFEDSPISLWEEDFSKLKVFIDDLLDSGISDLRGHFENNPGDLDKCASLIKVLNVNQTTLDLYQAKSKEQLLGSLDKIFTDESADTFIDELVTLAGGKTWFEGEIINRKLDGTKFDCILGISIAPGSEQSWKKAFISIIDITERKELERQLEIANERMSEELNFARDIQMGLLPLIFPAFPTRMEFNIYASLIPAREVGGDFYDFYFIDEHHLCFVVGDVSGKGAPGALLMAVSKTLIKSRAMDDFEPSGILTHVNTELSQNNDSAMFVTVFLGIMDIRTGKIEYTNAGHNPPYIRRKDNSVEKLDAFHGPVIGALPSLHYKEDAVVLERDDMIVVYSDGITESMNLEDELYSDARLEKFLAADNLNTPQKLTDLVVRDVKRHEGDAEQADDITILALKFTGYSDIEETGRLDIKIKNQITELAVVEEKFEAFCQEHSIPDLARQQVSMVLDEMLNNVVNYAYRDEDEHIIDVEFVLSGTRLVITMRDDGVPFNPFALDPPNIALSLDESEVGGLGIYLVRSTMDEYMYNRHIGRNVVTLVKLIEKE